MALISQSSTEMKATRRFRWSKSGKRWLIYGGLGLLALILVLTLGPVISHLIEQVISIIENRYQQWFDQQDTTNPFILLPLAFVGGVLASVSLAFWHCCPLTSVTLAP